MTVPQEGVSPPAKRPRRLRVAVAVLGVLALAFLLGPRAGFEDRWVEPTLPADLDAYLARSEADVPDLRPGSERSIVWADPAAPAVTPLSLVYLHGFSADRHEVEPLVSDLARELGANVYFARFRGHGRDGAAMGEATAEDWIDETAEAVAIGGYIGERVVIVSTSTGGTLAVWAAAHEEAGDRLAALVLISPNLGVQDPAAPLLLWPWGGLMGRMVVGPERCFTPKSPEQEIYWTTCYPPRALLPMMALVDYAQSLPDGAIKVPTLVFYSEGDLVVDPGVTRDLMPRLAAGPLEMRVITGSGDPEQHVIAGDVMSPETTDEVRERIVDFLERMQLR